MFNIEESYLDSINHGQYKVIYNNLSPELKKHVKKRELKKIIKKYNSSNHILYSNFSINNIKHVVFISNNQKQGAYLAINNSNQIEGLFLTYLDAKDHAPTTSLKYYMPIDKQWTVFWGGNNKLVNYHYDIISQRYAYDLLIAHNGFTYLNEGRENDDFYAFNQNILAPLEGVVVDVRNNLPDNIPGNTDIEHPSGNYVIIRHTENEYSMIAHFKHNSICVSPGEKVDKNTIIGKCGNSGNSTEPHIHFQITDTPLPTNSCKSLKINFANLENPIRGSVVER
ncbi:M23 family metallopeptidase [Staphylococcus caledonicus]|uniref:M23 family metallopeptidase n=1 Tax=Staphylococcus sp. acrmy TaxID=2929076 RepID=UPI001F57053E|nr:M23 family metallopeptidase [Staphylococcus sp. acrmy]MCI2947094.1 M23 family metallopeptidase [Staphylococcus sp. acrmy]